VRWDQAKELNKFRASSTRVRFSVLSLGCWIVPARRGPVPSSPGLGFRVQHSKQFFEIMPFSSAAGSRFLPKISFRLFLHNLCQSVGLGYGGDVFAVKTDELNGIFSFLECHDSESRYFFASIAHSVKFGNFGICLSLCFNEGIQFLLREFD
jgi:hypothetical protein